MPVTATRMNIETSATLPPKFSGFALNSFISAAKPISVAIVLIFSKELLDELYAVTQRPKFKKYFASSENVKELLNFLSTMGEMIELPETLPERCRDSKDDYLLELALISDADFLVTGDKDLLVLQTIGDCQIVTAMEFDAATASKNFPTNLNEAIVEYGIEV